MNQIVNTVLESSAAQAFKQGWRPPASNPNMKPLGESEVMLVCILNQPDNDLRGPLKRWSEVERGVATQVGLNFDDRVLSVHLSSACVDCCQREDSRSSKA